MLGVSKHIDECAVGLTRKFTIFPFYKVLSSPGTLEKNKEVIYFEIYRVFQKFVPIFSLLKFH